VDSLFLGKLSEYASGAALQEPAEELDFPAPFLGLTEPRRLGAVPIMLHDKNGVLYLERTGQWIVGVPGHHSVRTVRRLQTGVRSEARKRQAR
jgi:hypothetical protein